MEERDYYLAFSLAQGVGPLRFQNLLQYFGTAQKAWNASDKELKNAGLGERTRATFLENKKKIDIPSYKQFLSSKEIEFIATIDEIYPHKLREMKDIPFGIFVKGNKILLNESPSLGVVGTRKMTEYGKSVTEKLVRELVLGGFVIVSGLALGIDAMAHREAIVNNGKTIAVLGCGVDCCYPVENQRIYEKIIYNNGLIISEYPPGMLPSKGTFPARNRIIAGLSDGVLVTEAGLKSGSLITAEYAKHYKRTVFAVPGPIYSRASQGSSFLIKNGAYLVDTIEDIVRYFGMSVPDRGQRKIPETVPSEDQGILNIIFEGALPIDELSKKVKIPMSVLASKMTDWELEGFVSIENGVVKGRG